MQVVNLMSSDVGQVVMLGQHINFLWSCPLQVLLECSSIVGANIEQSSKEHDS